MENEKQRRSGLKTITAILACLLMAGCYFRRTSSGSYEPYAETVYKIEISGECEGISVGKYEVDGESGPGFDSHIYSELSSKKMRIRLPYVSTIKVLPRDRVVLGVFSNSHAPKVWIKVTREGKTFFIKQWDTYLAPVYLNLNG